jgi:hypothetical protein
MLATIHSYPLRIRARVLVERSRRPRRLLARSLARVRSLIPGQQHRSASPSTGGLDVEHHVDRSRPSKAGVSHDTDPNDTVGRAAGSGR